MGYVLPQPPRTPKAFLRPKPTATHGALAQDSRPSIGKRVWEVLAFVAFVTLLALIGLWFDVSGESL